MTLKINTQGHPFHLVDPSPWPFTGAFGALTTTCGAVMYMHSYVGGGFTLILGFALIILTMVGWWRDIVREGSFEGQHTKEVQVGLRQGMILFIVSEVMFFFAFFWAFFHSSMNPTIDIGQWPPLGIEVIGPWGVPLLNTIILLTSGATVTWAHHAIIVRAKKHALTGLGLTLVLAVLFTGLQGLEYYDAPFSISLFSLDSAGAALLRIAFRSPFFSRATTQMDKCVLPVPWLPRCSAQHPLHRSPSTPFASILCPPPPPSSFALQARAAARLLLWHAG